MVAWLAVVETTLGHCCVITWTVVRCFSALVSPFFLKIRQLWERQSIEQGRPLLVGERKLV